MKKKAMQLLKQCHLTVSNHFIVLKLFFKYTKLSKRRKTRLPLLPRASLPISSTVAMYSPSTKEMGSSSDPFFFFFLTPFHAFIHSFFEKVIQKHDSKNFLIYKL